jgi:hypothetical protein
MSYTAEEAYHPRVYASRGMFRRAGVGGEQGNGEGHRFGIPKATATEVRSSERIPG